MINTWNINFDRQVNIIIGREFGKTSLLINLYLINLREAHNTNTKVLFVPSNTPDIKGKSEGQSRLIHFYKAIEGLNKHVSSNKLLLIDNPERGLYIDDQRTLISNLITKGRSNLKLIVATHSPTIFYSGWTDSVVMANE